MNELAEAWASGPIRIRFEGIGTITLPPADTLAFLGGASLLAAIGLIEWPIAVIAVLARLLTLSRRSQSLRGVGEALALLRKSGNEGRPRPYEDRGGRGLEERREEGALY